MLEKMRLRKLELASKAAAPAAPVPVPSSPTNVANTATTSSGTPSHGNQPAHQNNTNNIGQGTATTGDMNTMKSPAKTPQKTVRFFVNSIPRKLSLDRLVWAQYYAWGTSVPARLCDNQEALDEPTIDEWPIPSDKAVVEVLGQEECTDHKRLILVERSKVFPYWAKKSNDEKSSYIETEGDVPTKWNEYRVKYLRDKVNVFTYFKWAYFLSRCSFNR
jgi:hypothetical protein